MQRQGHYQAPQNSINAPYERLEQSQSNLIVAPVEQEPKGFAKITMLTKQVCKECAKESKYIICFLGAAIIRLIAVLFSNFLLLWITSFVDQGLIKEEESKDLY